jgi:[ribosomal protein S5]-alanine N-acetyltransferase
MNKIPQIQTERLIIKELDLSYAGFIFQLLNSPGWLQYIGDRNIHSLDDAGTYLLNGPLKSYKDHGFGLCLVQLREDGIPIGIAGLLKRDYLDCPDLGFAFLPEYEGKGYAFESANSIVKKSKDYLELEMIQAIVLPENQRSIRLLEKLGMEDQGIQNFPGQKVPLKLFQIDLKSKNTPQY